jgi:hypothetical protein
MGPSAACWRLKPASAVPSAMPCENSAWAGWGTLVVQRLFGVAAARSRFQLRPLRFGSSQRANQSRQ